MSLYKRGDVWWYKFVFNGQVIRESAKTNSKTVAAEAERVRRREIEQSYNHIPKARARAALLEWRRHLAGWEGGSRSAEHGALQAMPPAS